MTVQAKGIAASILSPRQAFVFRIAFLLSAVRLMRVAMSRLPAAMSSFPTPML